MRITPDLIISAVLSAAVIVGIFKGTSTEVLVGLIGGLTGYLGRAAMDGHTERKVESGR